MKRYKKVLIGLGILFGIMIIALFSTLMQQKSQIDNIQYTNINMVEIKDGKYEGIYDTKLIKVKVVVEVKEHAIQDITIINHDNGLGEKAEQIVTTMKDKNKYDVDTVSGATMSSLVIKKAVNQALEKGM
ncbi:MAG: FMN-binding protein [Coprobacillus sp.]